MSINPQIRNYAHDMIQKRKSSASLVKSVHSADNVARKTHKKPLTPQCDLRQYAELRA